MAMSMGGGGGSMAEINVTPMIDILAGAADHLHGHRAGDAEGPGCPGAPAPEESDSSSSPTIAPSSSRFCIVPASRRPTRSMRPMWRMSDLLPKLTEIYANRAERVMFVKGDDDVNFASIADVIDIGKAANVDHIGLMTPKIQAGQ